MGPEYKVLVVGLKELQRELRSADARFPGELRDVGREAGDIVAKEARTRAPVLSGRLRSSIKSGASGRSAYVKAGTNVRLPYAAVQEFGWPGHSIAPQPYLYPAIAAKSEEVLETYGDGIDRLMKRAFPSGIGG